MISNDIRAVVFLAGIMPVMLGILMILYWRTRKTYQGFGFWVLANFSVGAGYFLLILRNQIADFFSIVIGNVFIIFGLMLMYTGIQLFFDRRTLQRWNYLILGTYVLGQVYLTYISPNITARVFLTSSVLFLLELRIGLTLIRQAPPKLRQACQILAFIFFTAAFVSVLRIIYVLHRPLAVDLFTDVTLAALSFAAICAVTVWNFYLFFLNSARLEFDLLETQETLIGAADAGRHKVIQLGLLDETSRSLAESIDEMEIMRRAVRAIVNRFGYAEAAISLLIDNDTLEVTVIDGTEDIGYRPGFRQKIGEGIIGRTAENQQVYISGDIANDPYYFSIGQRSGSAVCVPMHTEGQLLGVLYVESVKLNAFSQDDIQTLDTLVRHAVTAIQKARLYARSQAHLRAISALQSVSQTILSSLDLQQIFQSVVQLLKDTFHYTHVSIYTLHEQVLHLGAQAGYPEEMVIKEIPASVGISGRCVKTKQTQFVRDVTSDADFLRAADGIESEICVPIVKDNQVLGILNVEAEPGCPLSDDDVSVLNALVGPVVIAIENARLHARVQELALTDGLTNLFNRRAFDQMLSSELNRAARYNFPLSLLIIDMDSFKAFNDRFGHLAGDERLREMAALLRSGMRSPDIVARYGGEEFALILPSTAKDSAIVLAERLRAAAEQCVPESYAQESRALERCENNAPIAGYTISIGVAAYPEDGQTVYELLYAADQAEMSAKKLGKNCVYPAA